MSTANEVKKADKWGGREGYRTQPVHPLVAFVRALFVIAKKVVRPAYETIRGFMYVYNRERGVYAEAKFVAPIGDPILDRMGEEGFGEAHKMAQDTEKIVLWKTLDGRYFSESMIKAGKLKDASMLTAACTITDEQADELISQMEAMSLETDLNENEKILLTELRRARDARYAY